MHSNTLNSKGMSIRYIFSLAAIIVSTCFLSGIAHAQYDERLRKEVQVVRPYEPAISDAFKINQMPRIDDSVSVTPSFSYHLMLRPATTHFPVVPIPSARMVSEPITKVYKGHGKFGLDMFASPLAELYISNKRSADYSYGVWVKHKSSFQKAKLDNDQKVDANLHRTNLTAFGKSMFESSALSSSVGFSHYSYHFYGFDTLALNPPSDSDKQHQQNAFINLAFYSTHSDSAHLNYNLSTGFSSFADRYSMEQNSFTIRAHFDKLSLIHI